MNWIVHLLWVVANYTLLEHKHTCIMTKRFLSSLKTQNNILTMAARPIFIQNWARDHLDKIVEELFSNKVRIHGQKRTCGDFKNLT